MTRSRKTPPPDLPPVLTIPREEFEAELDKRIILGVELTERHIETSEELEAARSDYYTWNDYNAEFLRRRFTTSEIADVYASIGPFVGGARLALAGELKEYRRDVHTKVRRLQSIRERIPLFEESAHAEATGRPVAPKGEPAESVFVVDGHNDALKLAVHGLIRAITDVEPVILHDEPSRGRTLLEKFEAVGSSAGFAVVLLTHDDVGRAASADSTEDQPRARQNVVWEFGFFAGALGRSRVAVIYEAGVELPSDVHGLVYIPFDEGGGWKLLLARELQAAGINVEADKLL